MRPKKIILIIATAFLSISIHGWSWCESDMMREMKEDARAEEISGALEDIADAHTQIQTVIVNDAGDGCEWAEAVDNNGNPLWKKSGTTWHRVYFKVCDDDPQN